MLKTAEEFVFTTLQTRTFFQTSRGESGRKGLAPPAPTPSPLASRSEISFWAPWWRAELGTRLCVSTCEVESESHRETEAWVTACWWAFVLRRGEGCFGFLVKTKWAPLWASHPFVIEFFSLLFFSACTWIIYTYCLDPVCFTFISYWKLSVDVVPEQILSNKAFSFLCTQIQESIKHVFD